MRRRLEDPMLAAGPIVVAAAYALYPLAGAAGLAVLVAIALRGVVPLGRGDRGRAGAPVVAGADLTPRRPRPRAEISVAAVASRGAGVRALRPGDLHGGRVRRTYVPRRRGDAALRAACLQVATRGNARLINAAALQLGLADAPLGAPGASDPDPLLLAARWPLAA